MCLGGGTCGNTIINYMYMYCFSVQVRSQRVLLLHVQPAGRLVPLQSIGETCFADDELVLGRAADAESCWQRSAAEGVRVVADSEAAWG